MSKGVLMQENLYPDIILLQSLCIPKLVTTQTVPVLQAF